MSEITSSSEFGKRVLNGGLVWTILGFILLAGMTPYQVFVKNDPFLEWAIWSGCILAIVFAIMSVLTVVGIAWNENPPKKKAKEPQ